MLALPAILRDCDLVAALPARAAAVAVGGGLTVFDLPVAVPPWSIEMLWNPVARHDAASRWLRETLADVAATA